MKLVQLKLVLTLLTFCTATLTLAAPNLMLFPTRIVFDKNKRAYQVDLTNTGSETGIYRISLENKRMTDIGKFISVSQLSPGELSAENIIQFSPRQVELAPGAGQTIRIILRKPADLPIGEYRSHLVFTRIPDPSAKPVANGSVAILTPMIGASIPIIVNNGATTSEVKLTDLKYLKAKQNETAVLEFNIERKGARSVYGDLIVNYKAKGEQEKEIAYVKGIAVYSPNSLRIVKVSLQSENNKQLTPGKLTLKYAESRESGGKVLGEANIEIP